MIAGGGREGLSRLTLKIRAFIEKIPGRLTAARPAVSNWADY